MKPSHIREDKNFGIKNTLKVINEKQYIETIIGTRHYLIPVSTLSDR